MANSGSYDIAYSDVAQDDVSWLPDTMKRRIRDAINSRLVTDPAKYGKPLRYEWKGCRRLRVGDWRIIYRIEEKKRIVQVLAIKHRKEIYAEFD